MFLHCRLSLPGAVVEDGRESATYNCDTGLLTVIVLFAAVLDIIFIHLTLKLIHSQYGL